MGKDNDFIKEIKGYEGLYYIDKNATIYTTPRKGTNSVTILQHDDGRGYLQVELFKNGVGRKFKIHRLVAEAFIPNPENKPTVDHIDRDRRNNNISNLRWATYKEQRSNQTSGECKVIASKNGLESHYMSISECARSIGSNSSNVTAVCKGRRNSANGYKIRYEV